MDEKKRLFKQLKNGKEITTYYKLNDQVSYTIHLSYDNSKFKVHSYNFDGNDVMDEENYKDEKIVEFNEFSAMLNHLNSEFPKITMDKN